MTKYRTVWVPLFDKLAVATNGSTNPSYRDLDVQVGSLFLHAEDVTLITLTQQPTTSGFFNWSVLFFAGWDRDNEDTTGSPPYNLNGAGYLGAAGQGRNTYNTLANFRPHTRLVLGTKNSSGAAIESGIISAGLLVKLWGV